MIVTRHQIRFEIDNENSSLEKMSLRDMTENGSQRAFQVRLLLSRIYFSLYVASVSTM